jgi:hypothetical protein
VSAADPSKGASCSNAADPKWRKSWRLPARKAYPDSLLLWNDDVPPGHWTWAPAYDMPLAEFIDALSVVNKEFEPA